MIERASHTKTTAKKTLNDRFVDFADKVSSAMGTPANIGFWIAAVLVWIAIFWVNPSLQNSSFLPSWFTSQAFNFPLNTVTTLAELYIGFLIAAAANRVERRNREMQAHMAELLEAVHDLVAKIASDEDQELSLLKGPIDTPAQGS